MIFTTSRINFYRARHLASYVLLTLLVSACDTGIKGSSVVVAGGDASEFDEEDLGIIDGEEIESRIPGPSLGFALPLNGRVHARTGAVGSELGNGFEVSCTNGRVLAGISGSHNNRLDQLQALCVSVDNNGRWIDTPTQAAAGVGSVTSQAFTRVCPSNHAITGFTSDLTNDFPSYLQVHCKALSGERQTTGIQTALNALGTLATNAPTSRPQCAHRAPATGLYGYAQSSIERLGLVCFEDPTYAGRWSSRFDWPHVAIHSVMLADGQVLTYGNGGPGFQGVMEYNVWDPALGLGQSAHTAIPGEASVDSFCSAASLLPDGSGNVLMPGGDARPLGNKNAGLQDAMIYSAGTQAVTRANDMNFARWYPTSTMLPNGDILVSGGRDADKVAVPTPEVFTTSDGTWRTLPNANMTGYNYFYPKQFVMPNGDVFGIAGRRMYTLSAQGEGTLTDVGRVPNVSAGPSATAAMFEPGKILHVGGRGDNGVGAVVIDVTSGSPDITVIDGLAEPRTTWATSVLMADGNVMVVGGSYEPNDDVTAALGAEMWNPTTGQWTQFARNELPRLYHSSAVMLTDARILVAGGGTPGPITNENGEIFSPPYLFDDNGALAQRPVIDYAPDVATWGQSVDVQTDDNSNISRVTLVKTGSTTHGFNMDQRFLDLTFSSTANAVAINMPASANLAPPGYYMLFVHDSNGTPSVAKIVNLGSVAATNTPPQPPSTSLPPLSANTLLNNGGFEQGKQSWTDCAAASATTPASISVEGNQSMKVSNNGCLYQTVSVVPGSTYSLSCQARGNAIDYSSLSLQMLDAQFSELSAANQAIESEQFTELNTSLEAPENAQYASVTLYSEGNAHYDRCELLQSSVSVPPVEAPVSAANSLITNGGFEQSKTSWNDCSRTELTNVTSDSANGSGAMQIQNAGCLYQEFPVTPGKTYQLSCASKSDGTRYSSLSLTLMSENYTTLNSEHKPVGRNFYQTYKASLFTPIDGRIGAVTLYSEDNAQFDDCAVVEL